MSGPIPLSRARILFVDSLDYRDFHIGGTLSFAKRLLTHSRHNFSLVGLTDDHSIQIGKWHTIQTASKRFNFFPVSRIRNLGTSYRLMVLIGCLRHRKQILRFPYDALFTHLPEAACPFLLSDIPIFYRMSGATNPLSLSRFEAFRALPFQILYSSLFLFPVLKKAKRIFAINQECEEVLRKYHVPPRKVRRIYLGVDAAIYQLDRSHCRRTLGINPDEKVLVYTGRLSRDKGLELILEALALLPHAPIKFLIVGEGDYRQALSRLVSFKRLHNVIFAGAVKAEDLPLFLKAADAFCIASYHEGLSNSMIEALAASIPIISTKVEGIEEIIVNGKNGVILHSRDPVKYASAITAVLDFDPGDVKRVNSELWHRKFDASKTVAFIDNEIASALQEDYQTRVSLPQ